MQIRQSHLAKHAENNCCSKAVSGANRVDYLSWDGRQLAYFQISGLLIFVQ